MGSVGLSVTLGLDAVSPCVGGILTRRLADGEAQPGSGCATDRQVLFVRYSLL